MTNLKYQPSNKRNKHNQTYNKGIIALHIHISYSAEIVARKSRPSLLNFQTPFLRRPFPLKTCNKSTNKIADAPSKHQTRISTNYTKSTHSSNISRLGKPQKPSTRSFKLRKKRTLNLDPEFSRMDESTNAKL